MELEIIKAIDYEDERENELEELTDKVEENADFGIAVRWKETALGLYSLLAFIIKEEDLSTFPKIPKIKHGDDLIDMLKDIAPKIKSNTSKLVIIDDDDVRNIYIVSSDLDLVNDTNNNLKR